MLAEIRRLANARYFVSVLADQVGGVGTCARGAAQVLERRKTEEGRGQGEREGDGAVEGERAIFYLAPKISAIVSGLFCVLVRVGRIREWPRLRWELRAFFVDLAAPITGRFSEIFLEAAWLWRAQLYAVIPMETKNRESTAGLHDLSAELIALRMIGRVSMRSPERTRDIIEACRHNPIPENIAALAWDYVQDALAEAGCRADLPGPADSLPSFRALASERFGSDIPAVLLAVLGKHDGTAADKDSTALYSVGMILRSLDNLAAIDPTLMPISGDLAGNHAVVRINSKAFDHGHVYGFWHEDFPEDGLEPMACSVPEYLIVACQHFVDSVSDDGYLGPSL